MTIFKAFLCVLRRNAWILIMYSAILIFFSIFSVQANNTNLNFEATKPDLYLVNHDGDSELSQSLAQYLAAHNNLIELSEEADALDDALFYRQINYAVIIPKGFGADFLAGKEPTLAIRSTGDYNAAFAEMTLQRYLNTAQSYRLIYQEESELVRSVEKTLAEEVPIELAAKRDVSGLEQAAFYYNFLNYPLIVGCIFMICTVMLSFREEKVARRIAVGGMRPERINRVLLFANSLFAFLLWLVYVGVSFIVVGRVMWSVQGAWFILNSFIFAFCVTSLALLLANIVRSRNALNGLTNVIGLGSSFLCGAFVPLVWLPESVRLIAHIFPSYWYIDANEKIKALETCSWDYVAPILFNLVIVLIFALVFILATNLLSRRARRKAA